MTNRKITDLAALTTPATDDVLPIVSEFVDFHAALESQITETASTDQGRRGAVAVS